MRQAGVLAAAALHALDHHVERLAEDHANARRLAEGLAAAARRGASSTPQTNIVFVDLAPEPAARRCVERLRARGVLCTGLYQPAFRDPPGCVDATTSTAPSRVLREHLCRGD